MTPLAHSARYLALATALNLGWETLQLPLYTIWTDGSPAQLTWAVIHCTAGDALIAASCLGIAVLLLGPRAWPHSRYWTIAVAATIAGMAYTVFSEWLNVGLRGAWDYAPAMPRAPLIGTGVSPLTQWLVVPSLSFIVTRPRLPDPGP